jgi:phospholipid transport system transporter-binding protein
MVERQGDGFRIVGPVTIETVESVRAAGVAAGVGSAGAEQQIDLAGVTEADSAAVSLMLDWQRAAAAAGGSLAFRNLPGNLASLTDLYGVTGLIRRA